MNEWYSPPKWATSPSSKMSSPRAVARATIKSESCSPCSSYKRCNDNNGNGDNDNDRDDMRCNIGSSDWSIDEIKSGVVVASHNLVSACTTFGRAGEVNGASTISTAHESKCHVNSDTYLGF